MLSRFHLTTEWTSVLILYREGKLWLKILTTVLA